MTATRFSRAGSCSVESGQMMSLLRSKRRAKMHAFCFLVRLYAPGKYEIPAPAAAARRRSCFRSCPCRSCRLFVRQLVRIIVPAERAVAVQQADGLYSTYSTTLLFRSPGCRSSIPRSVMDVTFADSSGELQHIPMYQSDCRKRLLCIFPRCPVRTASAPSMWSLIFDRLRNVFVQNHFARYRPRRSMPHGNDQFRSMSFPFHNYSVFTVYRGDIAGQCGKAQLSTFARIG